MDHANRSIPFSSVPDDHALAAEPDRRSRGTWCARTSLFPLPFVAAGALLALGGPLCAQDEADPAASEPEASPAAPDTSETPPPADLAEGAPEREQAPDGTAPDPSAPESASGETAPLPPTTVTGAPEPAPAPTTGFSVEAPPEVTTTATSVEVPEEEIAANVDVVAGTEKRYHQTSTLGETLDHLAGVSNIATGGQVGKPVIRGQSGNRVRVLQDGIAVSHQQFGVRHSPNVDPYLAERLEVVRGPSAILYGSAAANGSVNVIPRSVKYAPAPLGKSVAGDTVSTLGGSAIYGYESGLRMHRTGVEFDAAEGDWGVTGAFTYRDSGGLVVPDVETFDGSGTQPSDIPKFSDELDFTDFEQINGTLRLGRRFDRGEFTVRYEGWRNEHNFLQPPGPNGRGIGENLENDLLQSTLDVELDDTWELQTSYTLSRNLRQSNPRRRSPAGDRSGHRRRSATATPCGPSSSTKRPAAPCPARSAWRCSTRTRNPRGPSG